MRDIEQGHAPPDAKGQELSPTISSSSEEFGARFKALSESSAGHHDHCDLKNDQERRSSTGRKMPSDIILRLHLKKFFAMLIFLVGACASSAFLAVGLTAAKDTVDAEFDRMASGMVANIQEAWSESELLGLWVHESCRVKESVGNTNATLLGICTRQDFDDLYEYINHSVGVEIQSIQFMPRVQHAQRADLEEESRQFYKREYPHVNYTGIMGIFPNENGVQVLPQQEESYYWPVHYVLPVKGNEAAIELDLYSSPTQKHTIDHVVSSWKPGVTDRLHLVQDKDPSAYSVILHHPGIRLSRRTSAEASPKGISLMVIRIQALLKRASLGVKDSSSLYLFDATKSNMSPEDHEPVFLGAATLLLQPSTNNISLNVLPEISLQQLRKDVSLQSSRRMEYREINIANRQWIVAVVSLEGSFEPEIHLVILGGCLILLASMILCTCFLIYMNRVAKVNKVRSEAAQEKSKLIVETAHQQALAERQLNEYIAHEVRNPLSSAIAALSFVSAASREPLKQTKEKQQLLRDDIRIIEASLQFINELLRNMLDMNRAVHQQMKITMSPTDILRDVLEPVASVLHLRGNKVEVLIECPSNIVVMSDRLRLKQIILNLAVNATKFVNEGFIRLKCVVVMGDKGGQSVQLHLEDSGPGIPAEKRRNLFAKFQESLDLLSQGTGVGLCLCRHLTDLMNGRLWLDEHYDSGLQGNPGTRFILDLNVPPMQDTDPHWGHEHESHSTENHQPPEERKASGDLIDYPPRGYMYPISSTCVTSEFGLYQPEMNRTPRDDQCAQCAQQDNRILTSTSTKQDLHAVDCIQKEQPCQALLPEKLSVLFVDDDTIVRKLFNRSLKRAAPGWDLFEAANGETALHLCKSSTYDVIFMDQYMASAEKQLLGSETVRELRAQGVSCIICGLSANDAEDIFLDAGADSFLFKPFPCEKSELTKALLNVLQSPGRSRGSREKEKRRGCPELLVESSDETKD